MTASDRAPYPGLRSFKREETDLFFGRDYCIEAMIERLEVTRFLAVLGSSGTGKSSLVKTGLLAGLEMGLLEGAGSRWRVVEFRPEGAPLRNLAQCLLQMQRSGAKEGSSEGEDPSIVEINLLRARLSRGPRSLIEWCREGNLPEGTNLLILVDQFEELFRYEDYGGREEAEAFVALLLESRHPTGLESPQQAELPIYVTLTMRSEYLGACSLIEELAEAINEGAYLTPRMTREQCREAIVGPAKVCGIEIEPALANRLLNDLASFAPWDDGEAPDQLSRLARRADQLPVMQHALNQMWRKGKESSTGGQGAEHGITLTLREYEEIGGVAGALDQHANDILKKLGPECAIVTETVFRALTSGTTVANAVRRPTSFEELVNICNKNESMVRTVVDAFRASDCNFLLPEVDYKRELDDGATIDIAHESLIRQWKRLSAWLEEEGRAAHEWQRLRDDAERGGLLHGRRLKEAVGLRDEIRPTAEWAERYGGGFNSVTRLITKSEWLRRSLAVLVVAIVAAGLTSSYFVYDGFQKATAADRNFVLAVTSAQKLLDQVSTSFDHGDITVNGAKQMLQVAKGIVQQVRDVESTIKTIGLLIRLQHTFSDIQAELGDYTEAYANAQNARGLAESLPAADSDNPEVLRALYASIWRMGDAIANRSVDRVNQERALKEYLDAEKLARRLVERSPTDGALQRELMFIHQKIGDVRLELGDTDSAIAEYRTALALIQRVAAGAPENRGWRRDVAITVRRIGQLLAAKNDFAGALEQLNVALQTLTKLAQEDPNDNIVQSNLATNHRYIADVYAQREDFSNASAAYRRAIAIQEPLLARDRDNATWQFSLASFYAGLGGVLRRQDNLLGALEQYRKAYDLRHGLAGKDAANRSRQNNLARAAISVADLLTVQKQDLDEAVELYREAIEILDEGRPRYDRDVFHCYIEIGNIRILQGDREGALIEYKRASAIAREAAAGNINSVIWQRNLMTSYDRIGDLLALEERSREALDHYRLALDILGALAAKNSKSPEWPTRAESLRAKVQAIEPKL